MSTRHNQKGTAPMPFINVKVIENAFTDEQKQQLLTRVTDAVVSVEGEAMRSVTWVVIEQVNSGDWAIGGQLPSTQAVHQLADVTVN